MSVAAVTSQRKKKLNVTECQFFQEMIWAFLLAGHVVSIVYVPSNIFLLLASTAYQQLYMREEKGEEERRHSFQRAFLFMVDLEENPTQIKIKTLVAKRTKISLLRGFQSSQNDFIYARGSISGNCTQTKVLLDSANMMHGIQYTYNCFTY